MQHEKCKIFTRGFTDMAEELEGEVTGWLAQNPHIEITSRHMTSACGINALNEGYVNVTIAIFYKED